MLITVFLMVVVTVVSGCVFFFISGNGMEPVPPKVLMAACRADGFLAYFGLFIRTVQNKPEPLPSLSFSFLSNFSVSSSHALADGW